LFPGQGIEAKVVLGALDATHPKVVRASELLGYDLVRRVEQVARRVRGVLPTSLAQPAIFVAGLTSFEAAVSAGERFDCLAGHSLGEYTALVAGDSIPFGHGLKLVAARGEAMQRATVSHSGGMAAVLGLDLERITDIADGVDLTVANDNSPKQVVLSGDTEALALAAKAVSALGGRCVLLPVEGAFHSAAMDPAVDDLADALSSIDVRNPSIPVVSNITARPYRAPGEIRKLLVEQLTHRVRFRESLLYLEERGVTEFVDLGPGDIVRRLARATVRRLEPVDA
jgi:malonyl CoA-acyl carrier protein transacylase